VVYDTTSQQDEVVSVHSRDGVVLDLDARADDGDDVISVQSFSPGCNEFYGVDTRVVRRRSTSADRQSSRSPVRGLRIVGMSGEYRRARAARLGVSVDEMLRSEQRTRDEFAAESIRSPERIQREFEWTDSEEEFAWESESGYDPRDYPRFRK
jgi:hypothetical protein